MAEELKEYRYVGYYDGIESDVMDLEGLKDINVHPMGKEKLSSDEDTVIRFVRGDIWNGPKFDVRSRLHAGLEEEKN